MTPELLESVAVVSEQLAMATGSRLLPLDLEATNNVVAQVSSLTTAVPSKLFYGTHLSDFECPGEQCGDG